MQIVGMNFSVAFFIVLLGASLLFERGTYHVYLAVLIFAMRVMITVNSLH